jgi:hypothetical protein
MAVGKRLSDAWYWLKCHTLPSHKWHRLKLSRPGPGITYSYGFLDRSEVMLYACFVILRDFVELEKPERETARFDTIYQLYNWWMVDRPRKVSEISEMSARIAKRESLCLINRAADMLDLQERISKLDKEDQEMLERLVKEREYLWT